MAKTSGGTRMVGPRGAQAPAAVDRHAAWRERETSERYSLDPEKVRFSVSSMDIGEISDSDLRTRGDYQFNIVTKDMSDGKYNLSDSEWLMPNKETTFKSAINAAIEEARNRYKYAGPHGTRDSKITVETEDGNLSAWVDSELTADNRVRISVTRFKL